MIAAGKPSEFENVAIVVFNQLERRVRDDRGKFPRAENTFKYDEDDVRCTSILVVDSNTNNFVGKWLKRYSKIVLKSFRTFLE